MQRFRFNSNLYKNKENNSNHRMKAMLHTLTYATSLRLSHRMKDFALNDEPLREFDTFAIRSHSQQQQTANMERVSPFKVLHEPAHIRTHFFAPQNQKMNKMTNHKN